MGGAAKGKDPPDAPSLWSLLASPSALLWHKRAYRHVANDFDAFHQHDGNVALHLFTTALGMWGGWQLAVQLYGDAGLYGVYAFALAIALTTPWLTALLHTLFVAACLSLPAVPLTLTAFHQTLSLEPVHVCLAAIVAGYAWQDVAHWLCVEPTYMGSYLRSNPPMLLLHTVWLMPLVIDAVLQRYCFLPHVVSRNRNVVVQVASKQAVDDLRRWINAEVPPVAETTHLWPHKQAGTNAAVTALENDAAILAGFRKVFSAKHYDVRPVIEMNEIYVTAVGSKKEINSDAVFYTPHTDGPYWWLPFGASLYRVLVGVTPNQMVRTRFNLQHDSQDQVVDLYDVLGFDYNRELHWIDHVPGVSNQERRSLIKLHFIIYPKGWHRYGRFCAKLNTSYNTWARGNFLKTLRPASVADYVLAWWIWLTTWCNAIFVLHYGWNNLIYVAVAYALGPTAFLVLTSFRHYVSYICTLAFRQPPVAHGNLMRDALLFKTMSMLHLAWRVVPLIDLPRDAVGVALAVAGFAITLLATQQLGMVRTYFGSELGFVQPKWISGFPYNVLPHPMIAGQLFGLGTVLFWWWNELSTETTALLVAHLSFYTAHMTQEIFAGDY